jgi:hypothetical protein
MVSTGGRTAGRIVATAAKTAAKTAAIAADPRRVAAGLSPLVTMELVLLMARTKRRCPLHEGSDPYALAVGALFFL